MNARAWGEMLRKIGYIVFFIIMGLLFCVSATLGVGGAIDANVPTYWGTFTEHRCEPNPHGCQSVGTWRSDDKSIVKTGIALDGYTDSDGTVRASYTPTGFNNDAENNIVHDGFGSAAKPWAPWILCAVFAGTAAYYARGWRPRKRSRVIRVDAAGHGPGEQARSNARHSTTTHLPG